MTTQDQPQRPARHCTVLHTLPGPWMPLTQSWLYHQIDRLPASVVSHVLCDSVTDLDRFPFPHHRMHVSQYRGRIQRVLDHARVRRGTRFPMLLRSMRQVQPDIVHSHFGHMGWRCAPASNASDTRHVVTFYGIDVNQLPREGWQDRYASLFQQVDCVLCEGPHMAACIARLGCDSQRIVVHHLGVRTEQIAYRPQPWDDSSPLRVLMAASFREKKGIREAIHALARVRKYAGIDIRLTLIGDAAPTATGSAERSRIERALSQTSMDRYTRRLGFQAHGTILEEAAHHHLFLHPSQTATTGDTEGGAPIVLLDMLAAGLPIVSTDHCDIPHVISDGVHGFLARERDMESLASTIIRAIRDHKRWRTLTDAGRSHVERNFDVTTQAGRLAGIYFDLIDSGKVARDARSAAGESQQLRRAA